MTISIIQISTQLSRERFCERAIVCWCNHLCRSDDYRRSKL